MEADISFYVTLPSNDPSYKNNKISNFRTRLAKPLILSGKYECALTNISFYKSWYTIQSCDCYLRRSYGVYEERTIQQFPVDNGVFETEEKLCEYLNEKIADAFNAREKYQQKSKSPELHYDKNKRKFQLKTGYGFYSGVYIVEFSRQINRVLGFPDIDDEFDFFDITKLYGPDEMVTHLGNPIFKFKVSEMDPRDINPDKYSGMRARIDMKWKEYTERVTSKYPAMKNLFMKMREDGKNTEQFYLEALYSTSIDSTYQNIFIYSDIVMPSFLGSTYSKLIRIVDVPKGYKFGEQIVRSFDRLNYVPVAITELTEIEIDIKDEFDENVAFEFGTCFVTLHFQKRYD